MLIKNLINFQKIHHMVFNEYQWKYSRWWWRTYSFTFESSKQMTLDTYFSFENIKIIFVNQKSDQFTKDSPHGFRWIPMKIFTLTMNDILSHGWCWKQMTLDTYYSFGEITVIFVNKKSDRFSTDSPHGFEWIPMKIFTLMMNYILVHLFFFWEHENYIY